MPKFSKYNSEVSERLRTFFLTNPTLDFRQLAKLSEDICGQPVPYDAVREMGEAGNWKVEREAKKGDMVADVNSEVNHIRQIVYQQIVAANESGLLITSDTVGALDTAMALLEKVQGLKIVRLRPGAVDASMVNAYMNLLAKTNMNLNLKGSSGKTSREQALDMIEQAKAELSDLYQFDA